MRSDLEAHWEVVAEGAQTILRAAGVADGYELLKSLTRGRKFTQAGYIEWVDGLNMDEATKSRLRSLSPTSYIGLAKEIAERSLRPF
jgi:adenylosuccinate lyase